MTVGGRLHRGKLRSLLGAYAPCTEEEIESKRKMLVFLEREPACFERSCVEGHFTGSCWLESADGSSILLTHHKKANLWLQLGGHADGDPDLLQVALREAREESGLDDIVPLSDQIFDIDIHTVPEYQGVPEHMHYDVRFLLKARESTPVTVSEESFALCWINTIDQLPAEPSLQRMFSKWKSIL